MYPIKGDARPPKLHGLLQVLSSQRGIARKGDSLTCRPRRRRSGARASAGRPLQVTACRDICMALPDRLDCV